MAAPTQHVLVLGSGFCAGPLVVYLSQHGYGVKVASRTLERAEKMIAGLDNVEALELDITHDSAEARLHELVPDVDLVVSMLPYIYHVKAAKVAIAHKKHFATTSYVSDAMRELEADAKDAGIILLNECGVDPGTDHASAMKIVHEVQSKGGYIKSFSSYCGGLPAPHFNDNPMGYKLSWAPRGVLLAGRNTAKFKKDGEEVTIPGEDLFDSYEDMHVPGFGPLEGYPNRDSTQYEEIYGLTGIQDLVRGTFRYPGWCATIKKMVDLGLMSLEEDNSLPGKPYPELVEMLVTAKGGPFDAADPAGSVAGVLGLEKDSVIVKKMAWLGLFDASKPIPPAGNTPLDALSALCEERMQYGPGEQDCIVMLHQFKVEYDDGRKEHISSRLISVGKQPDGGSAMARTVALPVAIAIDLILQGEFNDLTGIQIPITPRLYNPILEGLAKEGIEWEETVVSVVPQQSSSTVNSAAPSPTSS
ncbi:saccharopine dehydrogenase [Thecamonas trahens ATCC 50062]|uniref:Saccharopine dehydrogenase n=1 Tax=Thecamonas trahens ATCC 50062 TaxID=461836 RepID=A0A0L0D713_THETB|nr:saccharopine dehydrogenase [Thecamonas trahens ATCC 50062]KNC47891.1 saccharopine dehydrogenase [Thecamonas trahens ATCC 50062]|eukprot:XP_013758913.1 saccharopine dehydrogenase [Thecamonas trahens ATCC 50062]